MISKSIVLEPWTSVRPGTLGVDRHGSDWLEFLLVAIGLAGHRKIQGCLV